MRPTALTNAQIHHQWWWLVGLFTTMGTGVMAQDDSERALLGDQAVVFEAVVGKAFPGTTIDWNTGEIRRPDGRTDRIEFLCYRDETREGRRVAAVTLQFPDPIKAAVAKTIPIDQATAGNRHTLIAVVPRGADGEPGEVRIGRLDPRGDAAECGDLNLMFHQWDFNFVNPDLVLPVDDSSSPLIELAYRGLYEREGGLGVIQWIGILDSHTMQYRLLLPLGVSLENGIPMEVFQIRRSAPGEIQFSGEATGGTWVYRCVEPDHCVMAPDEVFAWVARE